MKKKIALFPSWKISKVKSNYYIQYTHYVYLEYIVSQFDEVELIAPIIYESESNNKNIIKFTNLVIIELPNFKSYFEGILNFFSIFKALKESTSPLIYVRPPTPLSWIPSLILRRKTIMHFVGDTIDSTLHSQHGNKIINKLKVLFFFPEWYLTIAAAKRSIVYTNGNHLASKLEKKGIKVTPLISSTIKKDELYFNKNKIKHNNIINLCYLGFLRPAKGIRTIIDTINILVNENIRFKFTIIGDGIMRKELEAVISKLNIENSVILTGHIENRSLLLNHLRNADIFIFTSLSEGSPRSVLEAMSQGTYVVSTPVGSLPYIFKDNESISYFNYNNANEVIAIIKKYISNQEQFEIIRRNAFDEIQNKYTLESFLAKIFNHE